MNGASVPETTGFEIAIIGMAGRFPGARNLDEFWRNLRDGVESISFFSDEELAAAGVSAELLGRPQLVRAGGVVDDAELFDASFFGITPREAEILDPQQRFFLECAWEALEDAGYDAERCKGAIGVFGGVSRNTYLLLNLLGSEPDAVRGLPVVLASDLDFLTTRVSYKLNLKGPSVDVQTACSTSLVAVHLACQSLLAGECDAALAGGVSLTVPQKTGYLYQEGGTYSPDGHCRAFDARAAGTVGGNGVGIVVLKRLADALADGDSIRAIVRGSAVNNDGSGKVGFTAPSVDGQAQVIARALEMAEVHPDTVGYVESHGTGTSLGDPIELAALTQAFRAWTDQKGFCAIGSLKSNIGHANAAAGVAGLIKTVLALERGLLPPSLHFERPNPNIDFANSPFYVNARLREWPVGATPRRAGVSSFGMGGTNAHVVVEQAPSAPPAAASRPWQLLLLSARSGAALDDATARLRDHLAGHPETDLADAAYTLQIGRKRFQHRRYLVCRDRADALSVLGGAEPSRSGCGVDEAGERAIAFMFPGQGAQHPDMARELYESEPAFREPLDRCAETLRPQLGRDLRDVLYPVAARAQTAGAELRQTSLAQPALFAIEYALAQLWMSWGVRPAAMIGHSIGEYVAACLAGVFSLNDALDLVASRARLMQSLPPGAMLAVGLPAPRLAGRLPEGVEVAALNEDAVTVVSGPTEAVARLEERLAEEGVAGRRLHTSHAFHSSMMDPILAPFAELVRRTARQPPRIPYVSNLTGTWITAAQATDPVYWARQLREPVRFAAGLAELLKQPDRALLEVGPGRTLSALAARAGGRADGALAVASLRLASERGSDVACLLGALGRLWLAGLDVDWNAVHSGGRRRRVPLPPYPFERRRYWVDPPVAGPRARSARGKIPDVAHWFYLPSWRRSLPPTIGTGADRASGSWLVFADGTGLASRLVARLRESGQEVSTVVPADRFVQQPGGFTLNPTEAAHYERLLDALEASGRLPDRIAHLWCVGPAAGEAGRWGAQDLGFYSLVFLAKAMAERERTTRRELLVLSSGVQDVTGQEELSPERATIAGPCKVIQQEYPHLTCRTIDVVVPQAGGWDDASVAQLDAELASESSDRVVAFRNGHRWLQEFEPFTLPASGEPPRRLREQGVYLVTGGLGGVGLEVAECLARSVRARLVLLGRKPLPSRADWETWRANHPAEEETSRRLLQIQALEALGSEVLPLSGDATDPEQLRSALSAAEARFGAVHGVIHAAGAERSDHPIGEASREQCEAQLQPRLRGAAALEATLEGRPLDFCLLQSSLSSVLGATGSVAYSAAHAFLDAFAARHNRSSSVPWLSVNWDRWFTWREPAPLSERGAPDYYMTPGEAADALLRVLSVGNVPQVVVSTGDLESRLDTSVRLSFLGGTDAHGVVPGASLHPRPELSQAYVAPRNPVERGLAEIWCEVLGLERVGVDDDFFELGGDSVLVLQVVSRANEAGFRLRPSQIFEHHSIAELAAVAAGPPPVEAARAEATPVPAVAEAAAGAFPAARLNQKDVDKFLARLGARGPLSK